MFPPLKRGKFNELGYGRGQLHAAAYKFHRYISHWYLLHGTSLMRKIETNMYYVMVSVCGDNISACPLQSIINNQQSTPQVTTPLEKLYLVIVRQH